ncbi:MAG: gfo/Idh/MocA family oxidoreductase [Candidatus Lokiarchaeota archaeon]|nr:gfo/Idh/MocA family oxidoreductase [Candidatus Lokiarchaeota archaeon]
MSVKNYLIRSFIISKVFIIKIKSYCIFLKECFKLKKRSKKLKKNTAVIGCGWFGRAHARNYNELSNLVAVCDENEEKARELGNFYDVNSYANVLDLIKNERLEAVSVVLPPKEIPKVTNQLAEKGIDVLLEKPLGLNLKEVKNLLKFEDSVRLTCGFIELFNPVYNLMLNKITEIGKIINVSSKRIGLRPKRFWNLGVLLDLGIHEIYLHQRLLGEISEVKSLISYFLDETKKYEDAAFLLLKFQNKVNSCIEVNWLTPTKYRVMTVYGENGVIEIDLAAQIYKFIKSSDDEIPKKIEYSTQPYIYEEPLKLELNEFLYSKKNPIPLKEGIKSLEIALKSLNLA